MGKHKKSKSQDSSDSGSDDRRKRKFSEDREDRRKKKSESKRGRSRSKSVDSAPKSESPERSRSRKRSADEPTGSGREKVDMVPVESDASEGEIRSDPKDKRDSDSKRKRRAEDSNEEEERQKRKKASADDSKTERKGRDEGRRHRGRDERRDRYSDDEDEGKPEKSYNSRVHDDYRKRDRDDRRSRDDSEYIAKSYYQGDYLDERERREEERRRRHRERDDRERRRDEEDRDRRNRNRREDDSGNDDRRRKRGRDRTSKDGDVREKDDKKEAEPAKPAVEAPKAPTLGAYIPPARLRMMQNAIEDKSSASYQRLAWEALKKSINGLINKVNVSNISIIVRELFKENLIRGRGILCRAVMQAQTASPTYTNVFAALVSIINTKFPNIGELLLKRLIVQFRRGYKRNDKPACLSAVKFIAHLVNQQVAHEVLALELLTLLLEQPTSHSIEVAVAFLKEVGARLDEVSPRGAHAIFERLRHLLHEGKLEKRIQYMIEVMSQVRKDKYEKYPAVSEDLDLVEEEDQFTHLVTLDEEIDGQEMLNVFKMDEEYVVNEEKYAALRKEILDESEGDDDESGDEEGDSDDAEEEEKDEEGVTIVDKTETNLLALRRTIYLTIQSSLDYEECCHKLLKTNLPEGQESELCHMILDCCAQQRTYEKFFGLLAQRFCAINMKYVSPFEEIFKATYDTVHRLDTNKLRNVAKFFAHLLFTDAISWTVLEHIRLTEEDTTSSSRIFVKILCQELSEYMGLGPLNKRFNDKTLKPYFEGLFPRDNPKNARFSINFFTSIGLGGLTDELREFLRPKTRPEP